MNRIGTVVAVALLGAVGLTSCGPDLAFVGTWNTTVTGTLTLVLNGITTNTTMPGTQTITIRESASVPTGIEWTDTNCDWSATATTDSSFTINRNVCPPKTSTTCPQQMTVTITQGTGTRTGNNISISVAGAVAAICDGNNATGTLGMTYAGSKSN